MKGVGVTEVVISEFMERDAVDWLAERCEVVYDPTLLTDRARLLGSGSGARGIIVRNRTRVDAELIDAWPHLEAVGRLGVGLDNIDTEKCRTRGISVFPALGGNAVSVAEYVIGAVLVLRRAGAFHATTEVLEGHWPRDARTGHEAQGAVLGLVGFGSIARATAERGRALGMRIAAYDPHLPADDPAWTAAEHHQSIEGLLAVSDAVSIHVPLTRETQGLIDAEALSVMKPSAILVNTARGGIVDEAALADALRGGRLAGAALDVFAEEPLKDGTHFRNLPNFIATPHIAGVTHECNRRISWMTVESVAKALGVAA